MSEQGTVPPSVTVIPTPVTITRYRIVCDECGELLPSDRAKDAEQMAEHHRRGFHGYAQSGR